MKLDLVESYWIIDDIFHNRSLFTNHTLSNQIQFSLDMFLKKSDFMRIMPPTNEEVLAELPYMKLSTIL
jgi:hypothetical protein